MESFQFEPVPRKSTGGRDLKAPLAIEQAELPAESCDQA
jgi:hypothetical protein